MLLGTFLVAAVLSLLLAANAQAAKEFEFNDSRETASGPLAGGQLFTATFETENDQDWYLFYIKTYSQMDISGSMLPGSFCEGSIREVELFDRDGELIEDFYIGQPNVTEHLRITLTAGRYYLKFRNQWDECVNDQYKFQIDPATAITTNRECGEAIVARDAVGPALTEVTGELQATDSSLAAADAAVQEAKAELAHLERRWEKARQGWAKIKRKIARHPELPRFQSRERRRLRVSRARLNRSLAPAKESAKRKLTAASEARTKVLAKRAPLQTLVTQHTNTKAQAEAQIIASC